MMTLLAKSNCAFISKSFTVFALLGLMSCHVIKASNTNLNYSLDTIPLLASSTVKTTDGQSGPTPKKKWQVGRVSRKHYEIVNMVWRKTKLFVDVETTTAIESRYRRNSIRTTEPNIQPLTFTTVRPNAPSTASYIEFYYLDDIDERIKRGDSRINPKVSSSLSEKLSDEDILFKSPVISFQINDRIDNFKSTSRTTKQADKHKATINTRQHKQPLNKKPSLLGFLSSRFKVGLVPMKKTNSSFIKTTGHIKVEVFFDNETCPSTTVHLESFVNATKGSHTTSHSETQNVNISKKSNTETTAYDRIKFFEIYDQQTEKPSKNIDIEILNTDDSENMVRENDVYEKNKVYLEDVDQSISHHDGTKVKNVKKHIDKSPDLLITNVSDDKKKRSKFKTVEFNINKTAVESRKKSYKVTRNMSRSALWSDYPFAAVYVYKPSQIHCDSAALSPHWLVAAGSCLSRFHNEDPVNDGRSAFVAYCGQNWWQPERVSYVKYSIVHPGFHPKDNTRRLLYNIGLVQVAGSMASCFGWAPLSLMSHHFAADSDGSMGTAVGWGLDRYDVRYSPVVLPKMPLSAFDGFVYSESCPGSTVFGNGKFLNEDSSLKNMYCLSLPPYSGEENDPVHGSLLLVGGKLIALYLQEERRAFGEQSAQYTGIWRLVPWVHEVAREQEEADGFLIDM